jgi:hypothetical protein
MPVWIAGGLVLIGVVLLLLGLCRAAAAGDRVLARARRDLAGPESRKRVGL